MNHIENYVFENKYNKSRVLERSLMIQHKNLIETIPQNFEIFHKEYL